MIYGVYYAVICNYRDRLRFLFSVTYTELPIRKIKTGLNKEDIKVIKGQRDPLLSWRALLGFCHLLTLLCVVMASLSSLIRSVFTFMERGLGDLGL